MTRPLRPIVLLALGGLALSLSLSACKKDADPQAVPIPSGTAAVVAPTGAAEAASAAATVAATPPPAAPPPVAVAPVVHASIDSCCAALSAVSKSGRGKEAKSKSASAAKICSGIAKLVKEGKTTRASAMTSIRAQLSGVDIPSECR
jgi:hypothetical protein